MSTHLPGFQRVEHVALTVPDLDCAVDFFVEVLGAEEKYRAALGPDASFLVPNFGVPPDAKLTVSMLRLSANLDIELFEWTTGDQRDAMPRPSDLGGHHLSLAVRDIDAAAAHLRRVPGVRLLGAVKQAGGDRPFTAGDRWIYFETPWGLRMELVERAHRSDRRGAAARDD